MTDYSRPARRTSRNGNANRARRVRPATFIEVTAVVGNFATTDHLNPEAIAAFADNELSPAAMHRAKVHLVHCLECRREVDRQRRASEQLKAANATEVHMSSELLQRLMGIAQSCPDGPRAEDTVRPSETLMDKLDSLARALRRNNHGK